MGLAMPRRLIDRDAQREQRRQSMILDRLEVGFRNRIRADLTEAMREMVRVWRLTGEVPPARDLQERLIGAYRAMAILCVTAFGQRVMQQGKDAGLILERKDFAETMTRVALSYIAGEAIRRRITQVADTTRSQIVAAVARGYADGLGQAGVGGYVEDLIPGMATARAAMIARTETHGAANFGAVEAARETGLILDKEWIAAEDERSREDHALASGQVVGVNEPFIVGGEALMHPGDPAGSADQVINCRCACGFVVRD